MYGIALSVASCLRAGTRVDVAWALDALGPSAADPAEAVALTPGGGRIGSLLGGALDSQLTELAGRHASGGRVVELDVSPVEAAAAGLPSGGRLRCVLTPASALPEELWPALLERQPVCLVSALDGDTVVSTVLFTGDTIESAGTVVAERYRRTGSSVEVTADSVVTILQPTTKLVIAGRGPIADALRDAATLLGWQVVIAPDTSTATGSIAGMSAIDAVVVIGHDVEPAGRALAAALQSDAGYIGAVGSAAMQQARADWLAYRGVTDLDRIHGPAGLPIGASAPPEIAVAILAEALATMHSNAESAGGDP